MVEEEDFIIHLHLDLHLSLTIFTYKQGCHKRAPEWDSYEQTQIIVSARQMLLYTL